MKGILFDVTKCIGCGACRDACRVQNNLPETDDKELSSRTFTVLKTAGELNYRRLCMHCLDPTCASVCPVGAFRKTAAGPVIYAAERCMGCRYCMVACPFGVPRYEWDKPLPLVRKCTMCSDRVLAGGVTACSEACPTAATLFGDHDTLIKEARARIAAEPGKYVDRIYGVEEAGGTSVLYISPAGNDGWSGRLPEPNAARTDGPLATLVGAFLEPFLARSFGPGWGWRACSSTRAGR
jgi:formate dehydrogenase iron-sulfur subunit